MIDIKLLRDNPEGFKCKLMRRGDDSKLSLVDEIIELDRRRRELIIEVEELKHKKNVLSKQIGGLIKARCGAAPRLEELKAEAAALGELINNFEGKQKEIEGKLHQLLLELPNLPEDSVPDGLDETANIEVRRSCGEPKKFSFIPKPHWELGVSLNILDFERSAKLSGARFCVWKGLGALLERALINFMLDLHIKEYMEILPPFLISKESVLSSGQLPYFEESLFRCQNTSLYLTPTAEVELTNLHRDEIISGDELPLLYTAYTPCFRFEQVGAGKESRGLIRQYQFDKVELYKFVKPEDSMEELEKLVRDAEEVLKRLGIPYRVMLLCAGELGPCAVKGYDIDAWFPGMNKYLEVSSCSNCGDYQARRANIRYRPQPKAKPRFLHTLNGSGLAVGRTLAALLENYQNEDGSVTIPEALRPYMMGIERIEPTW